MDEMKIGSKFTTSIISKLASLAIRKKFGYDVKLNLNEVKATVVDGKTHVHLDIEDTVGEDFAEHFGEYEDDSVFIRNDRLRCDYEILRDNRSFSDVAEGSNY